VLKNCAAGTLENITGWFQWPFHNSRSVVVYPTQQNNDPRFPTWGFVMGVSNQIPAQHK
jgi:hypothetical protein